MKTIGKFNLSDKPEELDTLYLYMDFSDIDSMISVLEEVKEELEVMEDRDTLVAGTKFKIARYSKKLAKHTDLYIVFKR